MGISANAVALVKKGSITCCKTCGEGDLAWVKLEVSGKWQLCPTSDVRPFQGREATSDPRAPKGYTFAIKMRRHVCGESERKANARRAVAEEFEQNQRYADAISDPVYFVTRAMGHVIAVNPGACVVLVESVKQLLAEGK